jgi:hypothetical protein
MLQNNEYNKSHIFVGKHFVNLHSEYEESKTMMPIRMTDWE